MLTPARASAWPWPTRRPPPHIRRWKAGREAAVVYLPVGEGLHDAWLRRVPTQRWDDWKEEIAWLTMYFSSAVWVSLAMIRLPR